MVEKVLSSSLSRRALNAWYVFGSTPRELRVLSLDGAHRVVYRLAERLPAAAALGVLEQLAEPRVRREVDHTGRVVAACVVHTRPAASGRRLLQLGAPRRELRVGEPEEDEAEDGLAVLCRRKAAVRA